MIDRYKIKPTSNSKEIGLMYFVEKKRIKVGCSKSVWRDVDFIAETIISKHKNATLKSKSNLSGNIYLKVIGGVKPDQLLIALESLKSLGHEIQQTKTLGRILR